MSQPAEQYGRKAGRVNHDRIRAAGFAVTPIDQPWMCPRCLACWNAGQSAAVHDRVFRVPRVGGTVDAQTFCLYCADEIAVATNPADALVSEAERRFARLDAIHAEARRRLDCSWWWMMACIPAAMTVVLLPIPLLGWWREKRRIRRLYAEGDAIANAPYPLTPTRWTEE